MAACWLVPSQINHTRHGAPSHFLSRSGLSVWLDLDHLAVANQQSALFSVNRFNLLSFFAKDYGPNFKQTGAPQDLAAYARGLAAKLLPNTPIATVHLLTFPRILGLAFNPISVYVLRDDAGKVRLYIYETRNTFGDMHSYVGTVSGDNAILTATKILHVSPFFPLEGQYQLRTRLAEDGGISVLMRYSRTNMPMLTATLRGVRLQLTTKSLVANLVKTGQWPLRPLISIHIEAAKLWMKKVPFFRQPKAPKPWSEAHETGKGRI